MRFGFVCVCGRLRGGRTARPPSGRMGRAVVWEPVWARRLDHWARRRAHVEDRLARCAQRLARRRVGAARRWATVDASRRALTSPRPRRVDPASTPSASRGRRTRAECSTMPRRRHRNMGGAAVQLRRPASTSADVVPDDRPQHQAPACRAGASATSAITPMERRCAGTADPQDDSAEQRGHARRAAKSQTPLPTDGRTRDLEEQRRPQPGGMAERAKRDGGSSRCGRVGQETGNGPAGPGSARTPVRGH